MTRPQSLEIALYGGTEVGAGRASVRVLIGGVWVRRGLGVCGASTLQTVFVSEYNHPRGTDSLLYGRISMRHLLLLPQVYLSLESFLLSLQLIFLGS